MEVSHVRGLLDTTFRVPLIVLAITIVTRFAILSYVLVRISRPERRERRRVSRWSNLPLGAMGSTMQASRADPNLAVRTPLLPPQLRRFQVSHAKPQATNELENRDNTNAP